MKKQMMILITLLFICSNAKAEQIKWQGIIVHISDSNHMTKEECNDWHKARGWDSCGYNFVIEPDGVIYEARGINKVGAHAKGFNSKYLGICFVSKHEATQEQLNSYKSLIKQYQLDLPTFPHAQFNKHKVCGLVVIKQIRSL